MSRTGRAWESCPHKVNEAKRTVARIAERGGAQTYNEAHIAARWHLKFLEPEPVACRKCGITEADAPGLLISGIHAALNWPSTPRERLRVSPRGQFFSAAPDLDYIPLCAACHHRFDRGQPADLLR